MTTSPAPAESTAPAEPPKEGAVGAAPVKASDLPSAPAPEPLAESAVPPPASAEDWREVRLRQQSARIKKLEEDLKRAKVAEGAPPAPAGDPPPAASPTTDFDQRVRAATAAQVAQIEFNRKCNEAAVEGRKVFPETFDRNIAALLKLVDANDPPAVKNYTNFVEVAIDTGKGPELLNRLGGDLNEAMRLLALSPTRQAVELTKLALAEGQVAAPSAAPKPITTVGDSGRSHDPIDPTDSTKADRLSKVEWFRRREEQIKARAAAGGRR